MYNVYIKEEVFPEPWKVQRLVLLPKLKKPSNENIIWNRLELVIQEARGLSERQYGFLKKISTIDALKEVVDTANCAVSGKRLKGDTKKYCALITLVVKNASNLVKWAQIIKALDEICAPEYLINIIMSYFKNRRLILDTDEGPRATLSGVEYHKAQSYLWQSAKKTTTNRDETDSICGRPHSVTSTSNAILFQEFGTGWAKNRSFTYKHQKGGRENSAHHRECENTWQPQLKYLDVILDSKLKYRKYLAHTSGKVSKTYNALSRMIVNKCSVLSSRRCLITKIMSLVILYAAPIWIQASNFMQDQ